MEMKQLHMGAVMLVWVGALNWGLLGLFGFNLVNAVLGSLPMLEKLVYILVGVSAVYEIVMHKELCKQCSQMMKK